MSEELHGPLHRIVAAHVPCYGTSTCKTHAKCSNPLILAGAAVAIAYMGICLKDLGGFVPRAGMCAMCLLAALMVRISNVNIYA